MVMQVHHPLRLQRRKYMNYKPLKKFGVGAVFFTLIFLTACQTAPTIPQSGEPEATSSSANSSAPSRSPNTLTDSTTNPSMERNLEAVLQADGLVVTDTLTASSGAQLILDAKVATGNIQKIQRYQYQTQSPSEQFRQTLFNAYFGERASEAIHDTRNEVWELHNSKTVGDYYLYSTGITTAGPTIPGEKLFSLTYRLVDLYPFEDNLLSSLEQCNASISAETATSLCDKIVKKIASELDYQVDTIRPYGSQGRRPYYEFFYRQVADGMPITSFNDLTFKVDSDGIQYIGGALYSLTPQELPEQILSLEDAVSILRENIDLVSFYEQESLTVGAISLEYIVVLTETQQPIVTPAWRFQLGSDTDSLSMNRVRLLAVDAVTGDLIQGERGMNF